MGKRLHTNQITIDGAAARSALVDIRDGFMQAVTGCDALIELLTPKLPRSLEPVKNPLTPAGVMRVEKKMHTSLVDAFSRFAKTPPIEVSRDKPAARVFDDDSRLELARTLGSGPRKVLATIVQLGGEATHDALFVFTGYKGTSLRTYLGELTGLFERGDGRYVATEAGLAMAGCTSPKPSAGMLLERWHERVGEGPSTTLSALIAAGGAATRGELASATGYKATSMCTYVGVLVQSKLARTENGVVRLSPWLVT